MKTVLRGGDGRAVFTLTAGRQHVMVASASGQILARTGRVDELVAVLADLAPAETRLIPVAAERPWPKQCGHAVLLLALSARWPQIVESNNSRTLRPYHLTLAYALPLALDSDWRSWAEENSELLIRGGQLVPVPAADLVAIRPQRACAARHHRLLRRHADTKVIEHRDHADFLHHWSVFTRWRYDSPVTERERAALHAILEASGCVVREFVHQHEVIARSVVCLHPASRILFDLMATWHPRHARLRPGVYSAVHNLIDTAHRGFLFSLCYGQFPYKDDIVGDAERLTLEDMLLGQ